MADTVSKWISSHIQISANQLTPLELPSILHLNTPLPGKISTKHTKHLHHFHAHNNIHLSLSTIFFLTSSCFSRLNFKRVNGIFSCKGYAPHYSLEDYTCPPCLTNHPLDPMSFTALCPSPKAAHLRQLLNNTSSAPTRVIINKWYHSAPRGEKRNYICTLIPNSLSNTLRTPPSNKSYATHKKNLLSEIKARTKPLIATLLSVCQWLHDNPIPNFNALIPIPHWNPWAIPLSEFSTSATHPVKLSYPAFPNQPPINKKPHSHRHTHIKPKPKKHTLIYLTSTPPHTSSTTNYFSNTFNIIPPPRSFQARPSSTI